LIPITPVDRTIHLKRHADHEDYDARRIVVAQATVDALVAAGHTAALWPRDTMGAEGYSDAHWHHRVSIELDGRPARLSWDRGAKDSSVTQVLVD
jgi:hypothetical protein